MRQLAMLQCQMRHWDFEQVGWYDHRARRNHDLFGFIDMLAHDDAGTIAIQYTSSSNMSARMKKVTGHKNFARVTEGYGWRVVVWGFRPDGSVREAWFGLPTVAPGPSTTPCPPAS